MTVAARQILEAFDGLAPEDQQQVAVEILRRSADAGELTDETFEEIATDVFRSYDAEEASGAES